MSVDPNPYSSPRAASGEPREELLIVAVAKCVFVGAGIGLAGVALCFLVLLPILLTLREPGLLLLLVLIPIGAFYVRAVTKRYLAMGTNRLRGAIAFGARYLVIGSGLGLILKLIVGGGISDTPFVVFCGSAIGTMSGCLGGAFQGWLQSRTKAAQVQKQADVQDAD